MQIAAALFGLLYASVRLAVVQIYNELAGDSALDVAGHHFIHEGYACVECIYHEQCPFCVQRTHEITYKCGRNGTSEQQSTAEMSQNKTDIPRRYSSVFVLPVNQLRFCRRPWSYTKVH